MWACRVSRRARPAFLIGRFHSAQAAELVARRANSKSEHFWLCACASAAGVVGLALLEGPVLAKTPETRQEIYAWGRAEAMPGGSRIDQLWPARVEWFEKNPAGWQQLAFGPNFGVALDRRGQIFIWGEAGNAGAAIGPFHVDIEGAAKGQKIVDVQCASTKIVVRTARGLCFFFDTPLEALAARAELMPNDEEEEETSVQTAIPVDTPLTLPSRAIPGLPQPGFFGGGGIKQMSIGLEHAAFVTSRGELFTIGGNQWGQCGVEPPKQKGIMGALEERARVEITWPMKVEFPETARPIQSVAVGGRHTIAMDLDGKTFSFGDDRRIQLGLGDTRSAGTDDRHAIGVLNREHLGGLKPKAEVKRHATYRYYDPHMQFSPLETLPPLAYNRPPYPPPSQVLCGEDFTLAITRDSPDWYAAEEETNIILACGENGFGQCGRNLQQQQQAWTQVKLPKRTKTVAMAVGQAHGLALMSTGELYGWGTNFYGQVGNGTRSLVWAPAKIRLEPEEARVKPKYGEEHPPPPPSLASRGTIKHISCGFRNSAVIIEVPVHE